MSQSPSSNSKGGMSRKPVSRISDDRAEYLAGRLSVRESYQEEDLENSLKTWRHPEPKEDEFKEELESTIVEVSVSPVDEGKVAAEGVSQKLTKQEESKSEKPIIAAAVAVNAVDDEFEVQNDEVEELNESGGKSESASGSDRIIVIQYDMDVPDMDMESEDENSKFFCRDLGSMASLPFEDTYRRSKTGSGVISSSNFKLRSGFYTPADMDEESVMEQGDKRQQYQRQSKIYPDSGEDGKCDSTIPNVGKKPIAADNVEDSDDDIQLVFEDERTPWAAGNNDSEGEEERDFAEPESGEDEVPFYGQEDDYKGARWVKGISRKNSSTFEEIKSHSMCSKNLANEPSSPMVSSQKQGTEDKSEETKLTTRLKATLKQLQSEEPTLIKRPRLASKVEETQTRKFEQPKLTKRSRVTPKPEETQSTNCNESKLTKQVRVTLKLGKNKKEQSNLIKSQTLSKKPIPTKKTVQKLKQSSTLEIETRTSARLARAGQREC